MAENFTTFRPWKSCIKRLDSCLQLVAIQWTSLCETCNFFGQILRHRAINVVLNKQNADCSQFIAPLCIRIMTSVNIYSFVTFRAIFFTGTLLDKVYTNFCTIIIIARSNWREPYNNIIFTWALVAGVGLHVPRGEAIAYIWCQ